MHIPAYIHIVKVKEMKDLIKVYKVLSDESRLRVLSLLNVRECCVCEVMQVLEISQSKASRILSSLYDVGILKLHKVGLWSHYSLDWEGMENYLKDITEQTINVIKTNDRIINDRKRLQKTKRIGPECTCKPVKEKAAV
jgi:ArsR family transcriptional regulator, arsenate/arsenite/antimonite-responsive transcriptional repressor